MTLTIGEYSVEAIETGRFALDGGAMFGVVPRNLWARTNPPDEQNRIEMAMRCMLLRSPKEIILVDTGMGDKYDEKTKQIYKLDTSNSSLMRSLNTLGVKQADVTKVLLTHLHFDHAGGAVERSSSGELTPAFPNAMYYVQKENLAWARKPTDKDKASYLRDDWEPLASNGMLEELDGGGELLPGIELLIFNGHTRAQQLLHVHGSGGSGNSEHLFFTADLMPTAAHMAFPWIMGYDNFPLTTLEEKQKLIPRMYEEKWKLFFEHDPSNCVATIDSTPKGFRIGESVPL